MASTRGSRWNRRTNTSPQITLASATSDMPWWCAKNARTTIGSGRVVGRRIGVAHARLVVARLVEPESPLEAGLRQRREVLGRRRRIDEGGERRRVRGDHEVVESPRLSPRPGTPKARY